MIFFMVGKNLSKDFFIFMIGWKSLQTSIGKSLSPSQPGGGYFYAGVAVAQGYSHHLAVTHVAVTVSQSRHRCKKCVR